MAANRKTPESKAIAALTTALTNASNVGGKLSSTANYIMYVMAAAAIVQALAAVVMAIKLP